MFGGVLSQGAGGGGGRLTEHTNYMITNVPGNITFCDMTVLRDHCYPRK